MLKFEIVMEMDYVLAQQVGPVLLLVVVRLMIVLGLVGEGGSWEKPEIAAIVLRKWDRFVVAAVVGVVGSVSESEAADDGDDAIVADTLGVALDCW